MVPLILYNSATYNNFVWYPTRSTFNMNNDVAHYLKSEYNAVTLSFANREAVRRVQSWIKKQTFDPNDGQALRDLILNTFPELFV